jgi:hypothetical protein
MVKLITPMGVEGWIGKQGCITGHDIIIDGILVKDVWTYSIKLTIMQDKRKIQEGGR